MLKRLLKHKKTIASILISIASIITVIVFIFSPQPSFKVEGFISISADITLASASKNNTYIQTTVRRESPGYVSISPESWGYKYILWNGDIVEVGDSETTDFKAKVKTIRNDGVCWFSLSQAGTFIPTLNDLTISFPFNDDIQVNIYPREPCERLPEGGIEYDITLLKRPAQFTITLNVDWQGITWEKILPLSSEYDEVKCEDVFGIEAAPYTITATSITGSDSVVYKSRAEYEVNSYLGTATVPRHDTSVMGWNEIARQPITYSNVSRTYLYIHRGQIIDALGATTWVEDINLNEINKTITFTLPRTWMRNATYPIKQAVGVDPAYTQDFDSWTDAGLDATWNDYDLFTNKGVPKGAVAEIIMANTQVGTENLTGVRTDGSGLNARRITIHEAEGEGETHCRMFATCHSVTGLVEDYGADVSDAIFYLVGYWENVTFTELISSLAADSSGAWDTEDLTITYANKVLHLLLYNYEADVSNTLGVRTVSSALTRSILMHEPESGGANILDMLVKADASGDVDLYSSDNTNAYFYLLGYFGAELDFVELWQAISITASGWQTYDLSDYLDEDGRMCDFLLSHATEDTEYYLGVRDGDDSTDRFLLEHEAESAGATNDEYTGFGMSAKSNATGFVDIYYGSTTYEGVYLTGYFKPVVGVEIINSQSIWIIGDVAVNDVVYFSANGTEDDDYSMITNTGSVAVDIIISGTDFEGGSYDWTLASSAGNQQYCLYANSEASPSTYNIEVKKTSPNYLITNLLASDTYYWSMKFTAPSAFNASDDGANKTATVTLIASQHT